MPAKKCCCCGLLSCFPCFAPITNPSRPAATHTVVESSHQLSSSAPPSAVASSQVNASTDGTVMQNAPSVPVPPSCSQGTVTSSDPSLPVLPSCSQGTVTSSSSAPSVPVPPSCSQATHVTSSAPPLPVLPSCSQATHVTSSAPSLPVLPSCSQGTVTSSGPSLPVPPSCSQATHVTSSAPSLPVLPSCSQATVTSSAPSLPVPPSCSQATHVTSSARSLPVLPSCSQATVTSSSSAPPVPVPPSCSQATHVTSSAPPSQPASSSTPSSSRLPGESDHAKTVIESAKAVDKENVDGDLSDLINYISELFRFIEEKKKGNNPSMPKAAKDYRQGSKTILSFLGDGITEIKGVCRDSKKVAQDVLTGLGAAHMATAGLAAVAYILERYDTISTNKEACLSLLKEMCKLAVHVQELQKRPALKEGMEGSIKEAIVLIVEASMACCTQIDRSKFSRFFSTTVDGVELAKFQKQLKETDTHMQRELGICQYDATNQIQMSINEINMSIDEINRSRQKRGQRLYPQYPKDAVGIEDPLKQVIKRLEMGSDKKAVAVILHGFGGIGKTTLADAVFAQLFKEKTEACKFSFVSLFQDIKATPNVLDLQKRILFDLKGEEPEEPQRYQEGQAQIESILEKEEAFIYIDNVLLPEDNRERGPDALTQLLPNNMGNSKKLRLLITSRNKEAATMTTCKGIKRKIYPVESLPEAKAVELFKQRLDDNDSENQLNVSQINGIVKKCGGVPALLKVLAGFINAGEGNALENYNTLMKEAKEKNWNGEIGDSIDQYVFAYDKLEDKLKDPFLDICSFFRGWDWKELSDIVGESQLQKLEKRALVTRDVKSMTASVHDVILSIGLQKTVGERFILTSRTDIKEFLDLKDTDLQKIKGIWASDNRDPLCIPASKLNLMSGSLRVLKLGPLSTVADGKCEEEFEEMVFFSAVISQLPFDVSKLRGFKKLAHLCYRPEDLKNLSQMPSSLRHIEFQFKSPAFEISSNCIQQLSNLRVLRLTNAQFKSLPEVLGDLVNGLEELSLSSCQYLEDLPASISRLGSLRVLRLDSCYGLTQLPEDLGSLNSLHELYLRRCKSLKALPSRLGNLTSLQELHLDQCLSLEALPSSLEKLSSLTILNLNSCHSIKDLPSGLAKLTSLANLNVYDCRELSTIPENIGQLKLNSIDLSSTSLKGLPNGFCNFTTLTELGMSFCSCLEKLPERFGEIKSLRTLSLVYCESLKNLPESFSQLKNLEHLDLSNCSTLKELCKDFKDLSSLRVLSMQNCEKLKKLPEDFHCLTSLEILDVSCCYRLEGKWIDSMVKMKTLQILHIRGSRLLEKRWKEIGGQSNQSWSFAVRTEQGLSIEENLLQQFQSEFDSMLTNGEGKPLKISGLPPNTLLLVMFDGQQKFCPDSPLPLLEENIDDIQTHFKMVYFGNHWDQLAKKVRYRILGHAPANRDAQAFFQKLLSLVVDFPMDFEWQVASSFQMSAEVVIGENGDKYLSRWKFFSEWREVEDFVVTKCGRYLKLKQLAERPAREGDMELLRELFASGEKESSLGFFKKGAVTKVGVDELQGKTILLDIRPANFCYDIPLHALVEMYNVEKERFNFEIITVPIMQESTTLDVSEKFSREVPWLVLQNPWQLTNATKYFLLEGCPRLHQGWDRWYPNKMRIIKSDGTMAAYNYPGVLRMVNAWGAAAYPFTAAKAEELIQKEKTEMEALSHAMFLFRHLERVSEQLRKATGQQKMICLCWCDEKDFTNSMKDVLTKLSDIMYIIYIPNFGAAHEGAEYFTVPNFGAAHERAGYFTVTICEWYSTLEPSKMSSAEMRMMISLSLSEHEAMRFWARMYSLKEVINSWDQTQLSKMLSSIDNYSGMFIMNEDGNLITTEGKEIVKLLSEKYSDDGRVKELMQQLLEGTQTSWQKTLLELENMTFFDLEKALVEYNEVYANDDDVDSEGNLLSDEIDSEGE